MSPLLALILLPQNATETAQTYVQSLTKGDFEKAATLVEGGVYSDPAKRLSAYFRIAGKPLLTFKSLTLDESADAATAQVTLLAMHKEEVSTLSLARRAAGWRVVPQAPDYQNPRLLTALTLGFVQPMVFLAIVTPIEMQKARAEDLQGMKRLATTLLVWAAEHDDKFPKANVDLAAVLRPYAKDKTLLDRLKLKDGKRWRFNPALAGRPGFDLDAPNRVVMLYEESEGKPTPRRDGTYLIATADGAVRYATPEKFKTLRWAVK